MIKGMIKAIKYKDINLYPIGVVASDEVESNGMVFDIVNYLKEKGVDARVHVAQGNAFGYIFCKSDEIEGISKLVLPNKKCVIKKEPVNKIIKQILIGSILK